jgi:homoserine kinase
MGCSLSGSGPSVFAWLRDPREAASVRDAVQSAFRDAGVESDAWVSPVDAPGVSVTVES